MYELRILPLAAAKSATHTNKIKMLWLTSQGIFVCFLGLKIVTFQKPYPCLIIEMYKFSGILKKFFFLV